MEDSTATGDKDEAHEEQRENAAPEVTEPINRVFGPTADAAERVLTFAVESLDMLKSVTQIFGDSVEKAEAYVFAPVSVLYFAHSCFPSLQLDRATPCGRLRSSTPPTRSIFFFFEFCAHSSRQCRNEETQSRYSRRRRSGRRE